MKAGAVVHPVDQPIAEHRIRPGNPVRKADGVADFPRRVRVGDVDNPDAVPVPAVEDQVLEHRRVVILLRDRAARLAVRLGVRLLEAVVEAIVWNRERADHDWHDLRLDRQYPRVVERTAAVLVGDPHVRGPVLRVATDLRRPVGDDDGAVCCGGYRVDGRVDVETRARHQHEIALRFRLRRRRRRQERLHARVVVDHHVEAVAGDRRQLARVDGAVLGRNDGGSLVAPCRTRGQVRVGVVRHSFRIQDVEPRRRSRHVHTLSIVADGKRVQAVLLLRLEIAAAAGAIPQRAEIEKPAVRKEAGRVRLLVDRRAADVLQTEAGQELRLRQHLARALVGHRHDEGVRHFQAGMFRIRDTASPVGDVRDDAIDVGRIVPEEKLVRLNVVVGRLAVRLHQAGVHVDLVRLETPAVVAAAVAHEKIPILAGRGLVDQRSQLAIVVAAIALDVGRDLTDLHRRLLRRIRLNPENVDGVPLAGAVFVTDEQTVARDAETPAVAGRIEIPILPVAGRLVFHGRDGDDPVQVLHVPEQVQVLLEQRRAGARVGFRRLRIEIPGPADADRRHVADGGVEGARLTPGGILREVDTLAG